MERLLRAAHHSIPGQLLGHGCHLSFPLGLASGLQLLQIALLRQPDSVLGLLPSSQASPVIALKLFLLGCPLYGLGLQKVLVIGLLKKLFAILVLLQVFMESLVWVVLQILSIFHLLNQVHDVVAVSIHAPGLLVHTSLD